MTHSDLITAWAVKAGEDIRIKDRSVKRLTDGSVSMTLHGRQCLTRSSGNDRLQIDGNTLPTRKSARLLNAVLAGYGPFRVMSRKGQWFLEDGTGFREPFTGRTVTVAVSN